MSKPAARIGDTTSHGGVIVAGAPTVMIGGVPAARANDMHTCPLMNPGTPPPPHVGGPVLMGSPTVMICGQMAARVGDMVQCSGPPDTIAMGCPTVLIDESASGGGGAGGGGSAEAAVASAAMAGDDAENEGDHFLDVKFIDNTGNPIKGVKYEMNTPDGDTNKGTLSGQIKKMGINEGDYDIQLKAITNAQWSKKKARDSETVKMTADVIGFESGAKATFEVWEEDANKADRKIAAIEDIEISGDKVEAEWQYVWVDDEDEITEDEKLKGYSSPEYYFTVTIDKYRARSGILEYKDWIEIELEDEDGNPIANEEYILYLSNGEIRSGKLDSKGKARENNVPPVYHKIVFPYQLGISL